MREADRERESARSEGSAGIMSSGRAARVGGVVLLGLCVAALSACTGGALGQGRSPAYLVVDSLVGGSGTNVVQSDVSQRVDDVGQITVHLALKNIGTPASPTAPTTNNAITINQYHVAYVRSDGGPVPSAFDSAVTATVSGTSSTTLDIVLVQAQAKEQAPLAGLMVGGTVQGTLPVIDTVATVTLYGQDQNGNEVSVSGQVGINFADWSAQ